MSTDEAGREFRGGLILGGERADPLEILAYDPAWPGRFEALRARLAGALGETALRIEHVGSTAVPGLAAKPVVDVQISVRALEDEHSYRGAIEGLGFGLRYRTDEWRYFRPPPGLPRLWQVHVCQTGSTRERGHLLFRDYLRAHPQRAQLYGELKRDLAPRFGLDRVGYTDAKGPFIEETLRLAEQWAAQTGWSP